MEAIVRPSFEMSAETDGAVSEEEVGGGGRLSNCKFIPDTGTGRLACGWEDTADTGVWFAMNEALVHSLRGGPLESEIRRRYCMAGRWGAGGLGGQAVRREGRAATGHIFQYGRVGMERYVCAHVCGMRRHVQRAGTGRQASRRWIFTVLTGGGVAGNVQGTGAGLEDLVRSRSSTAGCAFLRSCLQSI